ncbi:MAG: DNA primase, partial [Mycoplasmoidaceae bacterium]|nr:DNA primase [Mycoplasmoidaceae bacterium]
MNNNTINPSWAADGKINDVELARYILEGYDLLCVNEKLFDKDGMITDTFILKNIILELIAPYVKSNIVNRIDQIIETIQLLCSTPSLPLDPQSINVKNGTLNIDGTFTEKMPICANRLIVNYNPNAPTPVLWLEFLNGLLS